MALNECLRWCARKIQECFAPEITEDAVQAFIRTELVRQNFDLLCRNNGKSRLFIFYQRQAHGNTEREEAVAETPLLFVSDSSDVSIENKCCYFLRNVPPETDIDISKPGDSSLLFGEIQASALTSIQALLKNSFKPIFENTESWGKTSDEQKSDFMEEMNHFIHNLDEALKNLQSGLELPRPDHNILNSIDTRMPNYRSIPQESIAHFETLLERWCNEIEEYLGESGQIMLSSMSQGTSSSSSSLIRSRASTTSIPSSSQEDVGPRGEMEYWRNRMQKLTSIIEQLKGRDCRQVLGILTSLVKSGNEVTKQRVFNLLRRWKQVDVGITEAANEAKDNVKYLYTLERFIEPLYTGTAINIIDTLPALMNSVKMIHTIARYYNTSERMTNLFSKVTEQMIVNCKNSLMHQKSIDEMWEMDPQELVRQLETCLKLNEAYQEQYGITKKKLQQMPKGKQFDFDELRIFGKFDLFCRRIIKLIDLFSTIDQFNGLSRNKLEGMEDLIDKFRQIVRDFRSRKHDLLDFHNNKFDRDYVEFNVKVNELEGNLQQFINQSFEDITSIEHSLQLLKKFQSILQRESLKSDLDSKLNIIFQNYGQELEQVQQLYERQKEDPPIPRNMPPVTGNISWSRHLLKRIEDPMKQFETNQNVLAGKDAKRIIKMYNKLAKTLVAFEFLWYQAWVQSIEQAKAGLQATLIVRHPDDGRLYVNLDQEILQLIREAKCLDRIGIDVPDSAKIVLFQEEKFKTFYNELHWTLVEYDRIVSRVIPVTAMILKPHFKDMEYKLRPGMLTLTWTSMNVDTYKNHVQQGLKKLDELVTNVNDIIEHRIEKNLKIVSRTLLVDLPEGQSFTVEDFVKMQERHIATQSQVLQEKNIEIKHAVADLIRLIQSYHIDTHVEALTLQDVQKLEKHYNHFMYQALLHCAKHSMNALKKRIGSRAGGIVSNFVKPFFEVRVELQPPKVVLQPTLDDIQSCINECAQAILRCFKTVNDWEQDLLGSDIQSKGPPPRNFFDRITKDIEIVRVALLLTGCIQGIKNTVHEYLDSFSIYNWVWKDDKNLAYDTFMKYSPSLDEYEMKLQSFGSFEHEVSSLPAIHSIGALSLKTEGIKTQLIVECHQWMLKFSDRLHQQAKFRLEALTEFIRVGSGKLQREVNDIDTLRFVMNLLKEIREKESSIDTEINPVMDMYRMLESHLPAGFMEKEEIDKKTVLRSSWKKLIKLADGRATELNATQGSYKRNLLMDIREFKRDVEHFRTEYLREGPMVDGIQVNEAVDRLNRLKEEVKIRDRKMDLYKAGEELFALPLTEYPDLLRTRKELNLADQLFSLYTDVLSTVSEWRQVPWIQVKTNMSDMEEKIEAFSNRCKKLPAKLREFGAFKQLRDEIENFQQILPLLQELGKESVMERHWIEVMRISKTHFELGNDFKLQTLLDIDMVAHKEEIEEITDGADKQMKIQLQLVEISDKWANQSFMFQEWKTRGINILKATGIIVEELEEAQINIQALLTMRHVTPFKEHAQELLQQLSDTSDILERWLKVQMMWCALESVFTGGDIARQMPAEAKKFSKVDKDWQRIMSKASETQNVVECCANENLRTSLPVMYFELERCQKSLEGYLEQKRNKFPRFYFVSNAGLLIILSQGSDPLSMNEHYEKVFDAVCYVEHNKKDKTIIEKFHGDGGEGHEVIPFVTPVRAVGNIEDWLCELLKKKQLTMKALCRNCSADILQVSQDITQLKSFVDNNISQFALLGIQILWTTDLQSSLEESKTRKNAVKDVNQKQLQVLSEMSSWCLLDLGSKVNRRKIETLVTIHVHQRDVTNDIAALHKAKKINDSSDFEWLKQARFYWRPSATDEIDQEGASVVSITDVDFNYQFEFLGAKERLVVTPLTDRCYITLAQAMGMFYGGAPAGPAGTGKTESVKDLGRSLGIFVVVTNCTDQMKYTDCGKIFKGLCQSGLWGCFDEFNRIKLPVLSVVAQQILAVLNAKKAGSHSFQFPGDPQEVTILPVCGFFITMNPGYAGRQELPENLKTLFRGVAMMVPDFQIIMKVKLCSVGYTDFDILSQKFFVLYRTCKEQLSAQKHYDWGLRNILAVLRTAGQTKRDSSDKSESFLLYRTLRDMNLSKLVAQDTPLFLSLLADLFPNQAPPAKGDYPTLENALKESITKFKLVYHPDWVAKIVQLYETTLVRHGIMLVGPSGGGKTQIFKVLRNSLEKITGVAHKDSRINPKSIRAQEMYGEVDPLSGEWTTGVFAAMWAKYNNRQNNYNTWIIADGPVDTIWIEDLNTVLDDNKLLTLANGDRIPMTDNVKLMFEVETLVNASPATVSRAGIIYVSETDLDWSPVVEGWIRQRPQDQQDLLRMLFRFWMGESSPTSTGHCIDFLNRNTSQVMQTSRVGLVLGLCNTLAGLLEGEGSLNLAESTGQNLTMERLFLYSLAWSVGGLLEDVDRVKFDHWLRERDSRNCMPPKSSTGETIYESYINSRNAHWELWRPPEWTCPKSAKLDFSNLLVPTMDSTRALYLMKHLHKQKRPVLIVGGEGTAKTSTALMFFQGFNPSVMMTKRINFSSVTTPFMCQTAIEAELEKRGGKNFGPPGGKSMTIFIDDLSMPEKNMWGDQPTLEMVRQIAEYSGFCFLDKDKRGDFKACEDIVFVAAMQHPSGGKNDIPNRLKRNFLMFNLVLPSMTSINDIYGQMLSGRFLRSEFDPDVMSVVDRLTEITIKLWKTVKDKLLPTPSKFHYVFNMRELSRVFQGILLTPKETIRTGGIAASKLAQFNPSSFLLRLWKHECDRVFEDKLANLKDKSVYKSIADKLAKDIFGSELSELCRQEISMVTFLRDDVYDAEGILVEEAPRIYEPWSNFEDGKERVQFFLQKYNDDFPSKKMELILFNDALRHMIRICRVLETPRASALLVGVGGSGKQSLTKLAAYISRSVLFQITLTKAYNLAALMEDIRNLYKSAGQLRKKVTFLFTDSEIKQEVFLEIINSLLLTGDIPGLFAKDEMMVMTADIRQYFVKDRPNLDESQENLKQYFIDTVRDNLHMIISMSPMNPKFPIRARKFPGIISCPTIDWFLPWPEEALVSVSKGVIGNFQVDCTPEVKEALMTHMGMAHRMVTEVCDESYAQLRRKIFQTPKSYLSFIQNFMTMYSQKLQQLLKVEERMKLGLRKLDQGAKDVENMKKILAEEQIKLGKATEETNIMLQSLDANSAEAKKEGDKVEVIKNKCEEDASRIAQEKATCEADLAQAQPFVDEAECAIRSIKPAHIQEVKRLGSPASIIQLVFDGILILFMKPLSDCASSTLNISKQEVPFIEPSFRPHGVALMNDANFLKSVLEFGIEGKDKINEETIELLTPYVCLEGFRPDVAKNASLAAEGLCTWVRAMKFYHEASKIVKPKLEALKIAEGQLEEANKALRSAEDRLSACKTRLRELQDLFESQLAEKHRIEDNALHLQRKMEQASALIHGLAGERSRWAEDASNFADMKRRLVGDCAVACAFVSYCGPFNQSFRRLLIHEKFIQDCVERGVPVSQGLDVIEFLVDIGTIGDWNMQGLPTDPLSTQNGILVTRSSRYPLLIDPQGQALSWIRSKESENLPTWGSTTLTDPKLRDKLEFCMGDGKSLLITGVEEDIDPLLDPVLEKQIITKGRRMFINVSDKSMDYDPKFRMYFITRLPNPNFSPELQAKTTIVDFTVTMKGLEDQLLGKVIAKEQKALEDQLSEVLSEVNTNTKALMQLDASLLERLTSNEGNLLEDEQLIVVLAGTKQKSAEVKQKLLTADETKKSINEKREQFRPVATRGSVLYFSIVEVSQINVMYQTSLVQFLSIFMESMDKAEKASLSSKRVHNIIETMTYLTYRYINMGLYEKDKLTFVLLVTLKILVVAGMLKQQDLTLFLRGGAALDANSVRRKPFNWMSTEAWMNVVELSQTNRFFGNLATDMSANESMWRRWYEDNEPEQLAIPDYESKIIEQSDIGPFLRLLLVRSLRVDRCLLMCKTFVKETREMGPRYVEPITDTIESIYSEMVPYVPVLFLLSIGADPTESIESLARKRKLPPPVVVSMGEGQEVIAVRAINDAVTNGGWVLLQNCELGLELMAQMEEMIANLKEQGIDPGFRLFISALPIAQFPLGLLQMSTKVTNEPPAGLKAGLLRSFTVMVDQDRLERVETIQWRQLLFTLCFLHSVVQERRKFGPLGWCVPYEFNNGDLGACIMFLEKHLYNGSISWPTFQYMVSEVQYGGKVTDDIDRRLLQTYSKVWIASKTCEEGFSFNPANKIFRIPNDYVYRIPILDQSTDYHRYLSTFPEIDSPEIFGLHPNADLTFRVKDVAELFETLGATQPKGGSDHGGGLSVEEVVYEKAGDLQNRLPEDYIEDEYKLKLQRLGGLSIPLNIFLFQEIQRLQKVIEKVRHLLRQIQLAIRGEVVMTEELQGMIDSISDARVPKSWIYTVAGDEFSWVLPTLGLWFASLLQRDEQDRNWLNNERPNSFWLTGFFNPQGLLTAMKQEVTRKHKNEMVKWALDDVVYHTDVTNIERLEQIRTVPQEGIYIHGLFLDGCAWSKQDGCMVESEPKRMFVSLPVLHMSANLKSEEAKVRRDMFGVQGPYECPCYKYKARTDRFLIAIVYLKCSVERPANFWTLRGAALLCNTD